MNSDAYISENVIGLLSDKYNVKIKGNLIVYGSDSVDLQYVELDVPPLSKTFEGREEDMQNMDKLFFLKNKRKLVLTGLPGYGKSELAKQYANICLTNKKVDHIFWINAENPGDLPRVTLKKAYIHFHDKRCMFIFDNGIKLNDILHYGPPDNDKFYLLITSQESDWGDDIELIKLNSLSSDTAIKIYKNILCENFKIEDLDLYKTLADLVGCVPSEIQNTGNFIRQEIKRLGQDFQIKEYVENLQNSDVKITTTISNNSCTKSMNSGQGSISDPDQVKSQGMTPTGPARGQLLGSRAGGGVSQPSQQTQPQNDADPIVSAMIAKFPSPDDLYKALGVDKNSTEPPNISAAQLQDLLRLQADLQAMRIEQQAKFRKITEKMQSTVKASDIAMANMWSKAGKPGVSNEQMTRDNKSNGPSSSSG